MFTENIFSYNVLYIGNFVCYALRPSYAIFAVQFTASTTFTIL